MAITKIVITGGPGAGKTGALGRIREVFSDLGYTVLFVPEVATSLINGGVAPWTCGSNLDYQKCHVATQVFREQIFEQAARTMPNDKILIVCDRGNMGNKAYMTEEEFQGILRDLGTTEVALRDGYDAVFHLVTAAKGAEKFYTLENNQARIETVEQAIELDDKDIAAWTGHPHFRVIGSEDSFEKKLDHLIAEIKRFLGEPEPLEIERKFLIEYPDLEWLESLPNAHSVEISQTYLRPLNGERIRIRKRGEAGGYIYYKTTKRSITNMERIEVEQRLRKEEYEELLKYADPNRRTIEKTRWCLTWDEQYFEIDVFPFWNDRALLEIELCNTDDEVRIPPQLKVIREVTDEPEYRNSSIAMKA